MSASHTTGTSAAAAAASAHGPGSSDVSGEATKAPTPAMAASHTSAPPLMNARRAARSGHTASAVSGAATSAISAVPAGEGHERRHESGLQELLVDERHRDQERERRRGEPEQDHDARAA